MKTNKEIFQDACSESCGSPIQQCSCGITTFISHFNDDSGLSEKEFNDLLEKQKQCPKKYREIFDDSVAGMNFNAGYFVFGCPCDWETKYVNFLWAERNTIIRFYKLKQKDVILNAIEVDELINSIPEQK